tara:strand:- start:3519 stop:4961 length:1443 start_codon:yes stop_codon:yes gene_type:complete
MINTFQKSKIIFITLIFFATAVKSQTVSEKIDNLMQQFIELDQFSGSILLAKEGEVLYAKAFGDAHKGHHAKNNLNTKYDICSMGKIFTGISILQLEEQGKLSVNDLVIKHLKDFPLGDKITIHHLLSHRSGTGSYFRHPDYKLKNSQVREVKDMLSMIYEQKLEFDTPGERFYYSNSGIVILGAIIEKITGQSYSEYIKENILIPTNMNDTGIKYLDDMIENRATGYIKSISGNYQKNIYKIPTAGPAGGILSTVEDLLKLDQALYGTKLLSTTSKEKMFTGIDPGYGYAFQVENRNGNKIVGHGGGAPGFTSNFSRYLKDKYALIVLSNYDRIAKEVSDAIEAILYNKDYKLPKQKLEQFIYQQENKITNLKSTKEIADFLKKKEYTPRFGGPLNYVGYELMKEGKRAYAIKIFKLNAHLFPNVPNVYDSLGEAYEKNRQYKLALKNYEKAVELAKKNSHPLLNSFTETLERFKKKIQ